MVDDRKQIIIEAAKNSFTMFGYKGTTVDQIAKIAGVGKGTVYIYFENKEEILTEIIASLIEEMKELAFESIQAESSFYVNLHHMVFNALRFRQEHLLLKQLIDEINQIGTKPVIEAFQVIEDEAILFFKERLEDAMAKGKIKKVNPHLTAFIIFKIYIAIVVEWKQKTNEEMSSEEIEELFQTFLIKGLVEE